MLTMLIVLWVLGTMLLSYIMDHIATVLKRDGQLIGIELPRWKENYLRFVVPPLFPAVIVVVVIHFVFRFFIPTNHDSK